MTNRMPKKDENEYLILFENPTLIVQYKCQLMDHYKGYQCIQGDLIYSADLNFEQFLS